MAFEIAREMPYSLEAEQSVLGCVIIDADCIEKVFGTIQPDYFYLENHREIFLVMKDMFLNSKPIDTVTLKNELTLVGICEKIGGIEYLIKLTEIVPTTSTVSSYCEIVQEKYYLRSLIKAADEISADCLEAQGDVSVIMDSAEQKIYNIMAEKTTKGFHSIRDVLIKTYENLEKIARNHGKTVDGIDSGYKNLDAILGGINNSDLVILAARPAMGKTAFALNIAMNVAKEKTKTVCVFALEMPAEQLVSRMLATQSRVDSHKLRTGELEADDWTKLAEGSSLLSSYPILIDDSSNITVSEIKSKLRRVKDLGLVIIDYLQLLSSDNKSNNRVQDVSDITRQLKIMAKDLSVPIILLSQLNRGPDTRPDHKPMLSDLRESGSIEQDADTVLFLYRPGYYEQDATEENQNVAYCLIAKNRHGSTGKAEFQWIGQFQQFLGVDTTHSLDE